MNLNETKAHEMIRRALRSGMPVKLQAVSIKILDRVAVNRARDIIEDELERIPQDFQITFATMLLKVITHKYKVQN
jgi:hypothetical protein